MNSLKPLIRTFLLIALVATFNYASAQRTKFNFNAGWKLMNGGVA